MVSEDVNDNDEEGRAYVNDYHDDGCGLSERLKPQVSKIKIHPNDVINNKAKHSERKNRKNSWNNMRVAFPLFSYQGASNCRYNNETVESRNNNC